MNRFSRYSWGILGWTILVILWGTVVRATSSGAGCGNHWPSCNGEIIPTPERLQTIIEFTHRTMSGLALIFVFILLVWGLKIFPKGNFHRVGFIGSAVFIIIEALLGAGLVLFGLVEENSSVFRAVAVSLHLLNTFILLAFLSLNAWWASGGKPPIFKNQGFVPLGFALGLLGVATVGMSGAITALGDTLFPSTSIAQSFAEQAVPNAHFLIELRIYHPIVATIIGLFSLYFFRYIFNQTTSQVAKKLSIIAGALIIIQWSAGLVNVILLAPVWMQVVHLFLADSVWITYVILAGHSLSLNNLRTT
jgi:heme A synthase